MCRRWATVFALILAAAAAWAQAADPFASYHRALTATADSLLEAPMQNAPAVVEAQGSSLASDRANAAPRFSPGKSERMRRLRPVVEPVLAQEGVPAQLSALALVESGGDPAALSPRGARGLWQFMPETARGYGLAVDGARDERLDLLKSTRAAARYLRDLHARFGDWRLAFAAYNAGAGTVERASRQAGARDFSLLSTHLPEETRSYVPAVLAAMRSASASLAEAPRSVRIVFASPIGLLQTPGKETP